MREKVMHLRRFKDCHFGLILWITFSLVYPSTSQGLPQSKQAFDLYSIAYSAEEKQSKRVEAFQQLAQIHKQSTSDSSALVLHDYRKFAAKINDHEKLADAYQQLSTFFQNRSEFDSSQHYRKAYLNLADEHGLEPLRATYMIHTANEFMVRGLIDSAYVYYSKGRAIGEELQDSNRIAVGLIGQAMCLANQGKGDQAIPTLKLAARVNQSVGNKENEAFCYHYIGYILHLGTDFEKAIPYFQKAAKIRKELDLEYAYLLSKVAEASCHVYLKNLDEGKRLYLETLPMLEEIGDPSSLASVYLGLSEMYISESKNDSAHHYYDQAIDLADRKGLEKNRIESRYHKAVLLQNEGKSRGALGLLVKARDNPIIELHPVLHQEVSLLLSKVYEDLGEVSAALFYLKSAKAINDSLNREETRVRINELEALYAKEEQARQIAEQEARIAIQNEALARSKQRNWLLGMVALALLGLVIFWYSSFKAKAKAREELEALNNEIQAVNEDLKKSNVQLQELNKEKNNLISIVAHDLKSPFNNIRSLSALLRTRKDLSPMKQERVLFMIENSAESVRSMIDQILDLNKIESNILDIDLAPCDVSHISELIVERFQIAAETKSIRIESNIQDNITALADESFFNQVVENILSNALKFSKASSRIEVELKDAGTDIVLAIRDEGPGIDPLIGSDVFEKDVVANAKPTAGESSTGIGLAIVKKFVESMGGKVWFESEIGKGTTFYVSLQKAA